MTVLTKNVNIDPDALAVIGRMSWEQNGAGVVGKIGEQLDRAMYLAVNKGLEALGGKWNRKAGGHVFQEDPRQQVQEMLNNGFVEVVRDGFFETPFDVAERMFTMFEQDFDQYVILEPSAGLGKLCRGLDEAAGGGLSFNVCERDPQRAAILAKAGYDVLGADFLETAIPASFKFVAMNPPFENGQDVDHITHAFVNWLAPGGELVSVASAGVMFREDGKYRVFRDLVNQHGYIVKLPDGSFKESGTGVATVLIHLAKPWNYPDPTAR